MKPSKQLVLASTSPFRKMLLQKLRLEFETASPNIDETARPGEDPEALVARLAQQKALHVAGDYPARLIIGSDQIASINGKILGKPGNRANAIQQLMTASGESVTFHTGLCLHNAQTGRSQVTVEPFLVHFRTLSEAQIARYLDLEEPFDCAGSFKSEGYGITLFNALEGRDPNTLIGLPLIELTTMLENEGFDLP